ncbi:type II toxin-antitoxin system RelE/ParE family toxin [Acuticoccus sp. M5D2P5]|uniref:type II toxin-antitoxin system RelE family toxin n=1 Tax=Acuticoccus kalidii TaxID=2910977 RepID=UPI001F19D680|nr:type II toxin-antitoxin system RelE/ParE family toxin [Acuticoccus kalidii]MCF3935024.1 type II toxin-antitoxin system RelE/ParE family toxin [Acuticoccus kalidii]
MRSITYTKAATKTLRKMPANEAKRIRAKIEAYAVDPASVANNVKALQNSPYIRLRVGDWRVIMQDGDVLMIVKVGARGSVYE